MIKKPTNQTEFMRASEVGAMIEKLSSEFRVLGEGLSIVRSDMNKLTAKVDMIYEELDRQRMDIIIIKKDIAEIKTIIRSHDDRLVKLFCFAL